MDKQDLALFVGPELPDSSSSIWQVIVSPSRIDVRRVKLQQLVQIRVRAACRVGDTSER
jgi:hypothetical protein